MEPITLEDSLKLNVPEIDSQHQTLIGLINEIHECMLYRADKAVLDGLLARLLEHTGDHFSYEEQLMSRYGYPGYGQHRSQHARLLQHLEGLMQRFRDGDLLMSFAVVIELQRWATIHIEKSDKPLGEFLLGRQTVNTVSD